MSKYKFIKQTDDETTLVIGMRNSQGYYKRVWDHALWSPETALEEALATREEVIPRVHGYAALRDLKVEEAMGF